MDIKRLFQHLLFWVIMLLWTSTVYVYNLHHIWPYIQFSLVRFPLIITSTYIVIYYFLPRWIIQEKKYALFAFAFFVNFLFTSLIDRLIIGSDLVDRILADTGLIYRFFNEIPIFRNSFVLLSIICLASIIRFFKLYVKEEQRKHQLEEEQLQTRLNFLKTQVNPHFLFNALNNLYSMAIEKNQTTIASGLDNLSGIMHYLTYESNAAKVPLGKEIELLQNYIEIQHLRLGETDDTTISFQMKDIHHRAQIAPVILLPLVENAFKHGIRPEEKCLVSIRLFMEQHRLNFSIQNTSFEPQKKYFNHPGIGISNVKNRLELIYPKRYEFTLKQSENYFYTDLQIDLNTK